MELWKCPEAEVVCKIDLRAQLALRFSAATE